MTPKISAVVLTFNEERNLRNALRSLVRWVDEVVIVDMQSDDRTVEIARSFGAKIISHDRTGFVEPARAFGMAQAVGDWIINIDADEVVPVGLSQELLRIAEGNLTDVCLIPRLNYIGGSPLLHSGWGPEHDRQLRFFRAGSVVFSPLIHHRPEPVAGTRVLSLPYRAGMALVHFNYLNAAHFIQKLNQYTDVEARQAKQRGEEVSFTKLLLRPVAIFFKRFVLQRGFLDGWNGFYYSFLMLVYKLTAAAKLREIEREGSSEAVQQKYCEIAESYLSADQPSGERYSNFQGKQPI